MIDLGPFVPALLLIGAATWFGLRDRNRFHEARHRQVGAWVLGLAVAATVLSTWDTVIPSTPLAQARLQVADAPLHVDLSGRAALVVTGELPHVETGEGASGTYRIGVTTPDGHVERFSGRIEEHWEQQRVARRGHLQVLTVHNDARYPLPSGPVDVSVEAKDGSLPGPLTLQVLPAPVPAWLLAGAGLVLTVGAALLEARESRPAAFSLDVGTLGAFAALLATQISPASPGSEVMGTGLVSLLVGVGCALLLRFGMGRFASP